MSHQASVQTEWLTGVVWRGLDAGLCVWAGVALGGAALLRDCSCGRGGAELGDAGLGDAGRGGAGGQAVRSRADDFAAQRAKLLSLPPKNASMFIDSIAYE